MTGKVVIVGGVAGGMSCAARLKRLDESLEVVVFEKGEHVSFANCGMPYFIGGVIEDREKMQVQTPEGLQGRYGLDVRVRHEVTAIHRDRKTVAVKNLQSGKVFEEPYDTLVLSPGAEPIRPPIPGADKEHVFTLRDLGDMDRIATSAGSSRQAVIVGGGFIGLELAENLRNRGLEVSLVEMLDQVLPPMDREMTQPLIQQLKLHGVELFLEETAEAIEDKAVRLKSGRTIPCDFVCLSVGVRPAGGLAKEAGLDLGPRGHIRVNERMATSDPHIYAVGDAVETVEWGTGEAAAVPLAGPAARQGRIAADVICGRGSAYRGAQGTAIVKVFNLAAGQTGLSEKRLKALGKSYLRLYLHPTQHPGYYPDAQPINFKLLFSPEGEIFGAQAVGAEGVKTMIDAMAVARQGGLKVEDLEHLELAYSPQWGGAKDPINMAGFAAANLARGDMEVVEADGVPQDLLWVDVRKPDETEAGVLPGSVNIPLDDLRDRVGELPRDRELGVYCAVGQRGYVGYRYLKQQGFKVRNLNGGYRTWSLYQENGGEPTDATADATAAEAGRTAGGVPPGEPSRTVKLDVCGLQCPGPIAKVKEAMAGVEPGEVLEVVASDPGFAADIPAWCRATGNTLIEVKPEGQHYVARIRPGVLPGSSPGVSPDASPGCEAAEGPAASDGDGKGTTLVLFSNDLDRALAAFIIANGAASMGSETTIFFTFWGLNVLRRDNPPPLKKGLVERMFGFMMPKGPGRLKLSKMHMAGMGTAMIKQVMKTKNAMSLPELIQSAKNSGVRLVACAMSMDLMGIRQEELIDGVEIAGVGNYLGTASEGKVNLFV